MQQITVHKSVLALVGYLTALSTRIIRSTKNRNLNNYPEEKYFRRENASGCKRGPFIPRSPIMVLMDLSKVTVIPNHRGASGDVKTISQLSNSFEPAKKITFIIEVDAWTSSCFCKNTSFSGNC